MPQSDTGSGTPGQSSSGAAASPSTNGKEASQSDTGPGTPVKTNDDAAASPPTNAGRPPYFINPPQYLKGALVTYDPETQKTVNRIPFQYNPQELTRTLKPRTYTGKQGKDLIGAPDQTIAATVRLQAVDSMVSDSQNGDKKAASLGLYAQIAALELLIYPDSSVIDAYKTDLASGTKGAVPPSGLPVLFQWGENRLLPVRLTSIEVKETLFNISLSPIAADVTLSMEVERIIDATDMPYELLKINLQGLESMAQYDDAGSMDWKKSGGYS